ncbi:internal scaffolding protein [Blackfly microvirus SF02]|uniref:Internal scaffolding protein n=1 Tax=Blackfly microvirus SF02 TaxID=2576452 RepID=A0A4P8PK67_9VIRU|nr:internal scaffolding protein [Blackfly microvirus SF02]
MGFGPRNPAWTGFYVEHDPVMLDDFGPSRTRQEFKDECDINTIMMQYETTGTISHFNDGMPSYLDLTQYPTDLQGTLEALKAAEDSFMRLPAHIRREFENDPVSFVGFAEDPSNLDKMREWGLAPPATLPDYPRDDEADKAARPKAD